MKKLKVHFTYMSFILLEKTDPEPHCHGHVASDSVGLLGKGQKGVSGGERSAFFLEEI